MLCFASLSKLSMHNFLLYVISRAGNIVDLSNSVRGFRIVLWIRPFFRIRIRLSKKDFWIRSIIFCFIKIIGTFRVSFEIRKTN